MKSLPTENPLDHPYTGGYDTAQATNYPPLMIKEVTSKNQFTEFIELPFRLYHKNKYYVPPLKKDIEETFNQKKNPAFEFCEARQWLAYRGDKVVGRIAGIINHAFIDKWKNNYVRFGWMDFEEDAEIAKALLEEVERWARERGMTAVHGPLGFTNFDHAGLLIEGYDQLGTMATLYNYPYYKSYMERAGYHKDVDWIEYKIKVPREMPEQLEKMADTIEKRYRLRVVRSTTMKDLMPFAKDIFSLLNEAYADLYGIVALNDRQIDYNIKKYFSFIRPDFVSLVLDENNVLVACGITMPSLSHAMQKASGRLFPFGLIHLLKAFRKNNLADLCLVAVRKGLQGKGVNSILMREMNRTYIKNGIEYAESNAELEENTKVQSLWKHFDAEQHKRRRCYIKYIYP